MRLRALVVYAADRWPLRTSVADHLLAPARHPAFETVYFNALRRRAPAWLAGARFDLVIYHTTFLAQRWQRAVFARARRNVAPLRAINCPRVAIPQDEFLHTDVLCEFLRDFDVRHVLSCAPASEWQKIYGGLHPGPVLRTVLTGYLAASTVDRLERLGARAAEARPVDVGYRAWRAQPWLGRHGMLKTTIAGAVTAAAPTHGLSVDISLEERDTLIGDDWLRFLLRCRYTLGVEGGASILDADGSVKECTEAFLADHPDASFEAVEGACFPGRDGELDLFALSPRHLEACASRTGQILVRGSYNGLLQADVHYLPLEPDFSNLDDVLEAARDEERRQVMVERAHDDIVGSAAWTYDRFIDEVLAVVGPSPQPTRPLPASARLRAGLSVAWDRLDRLLLRGRPFARRVLHRAGLLGLARVARARMRRTLDADG